MPSREALAVASDPRPGTGLVHGWFAGLIEGRRGDDAALRRSIAELNSLGLARLEPELDASRFRVWVDERRLTRKRFAAQNIERFAALLQVLVETSADPSAVESNMRCVEIFEDRALETLFAVTHGSVTRLGQARPLVPADFESRDALEPTPLLEKLGRGRAVLAAALCCVLAATAVLQAGWIDRLFSEDASNLKRSPGPFGALLEMELQNRWGGYVLHLRRGENYPRSLEDAERLLRKVRTPLERAALAAVVDGTSVTVSVMNVDGVVLDSAPIPLAMLLVEEQARIDLSLEGFISAHGIGLGLAQPVPR